MPLLERGLPFITEIHLTGNVPHIPMNVRKAGGYVDDAGKARWGCPCIHMRRKRR